MIRYSWSLLFDQRFRPTLTPGVIAATYYGNRNLSTTMKGRKWVLVKPFDGLPKRSDLEVVEFEVPEIQDGDILVETAALSVDPYMRLWADWVKIGDTMMGQIVGRVMESKDPSIESGERVLISPGWVTHAVVKAKDLVKIPDLPSNVPLSLTLGTLGMPGLTAYFGLLEVAQLKSTDTVLVNAAAGAVGSVAGQIAKMKGCRVMGSAGSDEKVRYLKEELGFDEAYNYKTVTPDKLSSELSKLAPDGIDVFFENVGGEASSVVYHHLRKNARVAVSGAISNYNSPSSAKPKVSEFLHLLIYNSVSIKGFLVTDFFDRREGAYKEMTKWIQEEKLKYKEHKYKGFDNMYEAFMDLFSGKNLGKVVVEM